ncbi:hypothetical protein [Gracilimonas sp. BCB1]|uniref:hypothetical protein n=1 Tax=Gracilimonas sp. BCB1 TaxID=3152362 RepID=UPI0032D9138D
MSTFLTIIATFVIFFFLKFIYDSYLTDNTEKRWSEYKKSFPVEANWAERNPLKPLPENLDNRLGNLAHRTPQFMNFFNRLQPVLKPQITANDASRFEFKIPVNKSGKLIGYKLVGIQENHKGTVEMYLYHLSLSGKKFTVPHFKLRGNEDSAEIESNLNYLINLLYSNAEYKSHFSGESTKTTSKPTSANTKSLKRDSRPVINLKDEIPLVYKFMHFIKDNIVLNDSDIRIKMNSPIEYRFSFPINRRNDASWGIGTVKFSKSNSSRFSHKYGYLVKYRLDLSIENEDGLIHEAEQKSFDKRNKLSELIFFYTVQLKELEEKEDGLPF